MADGLAEQGYLVIVAKLLVTAGKPGTDGDALAPDETFNMDWIKTFPWTVQKPKVPWRACFVNSDEISLSTGRDTHQLQESTPIS